MATNHSPGSPRFVTSRAVRRQGAEQAGWRWVACCLCVWCWSTVNGWGWPAGDVRGEPLVQVLNDDPLSRETHDAWYRQQLRELSEKLPSGTDPIVAREILAQELVRDPGRLYIFLPTAPTAKEFSAGPHAESLSNIRREYAQRLWRLTQDLAAAERGAEAYQLAHECLYWDPELGDARRALGHRETEEGWQPYSERLKIRRATRPHPVTRWPAGSYWTVSTDHFEIVSTADEARTLKLAEQLQRWQWVWRQVFFDYWSNAGSLQKWLAGDPPSRSSARKYEVIFFREQAEYVETLRPLIPGIEVSSGFYSDELKTSFFYDSDDRQIEETWRHELTHQLFKESVRTVNQPFANGYLWLGEGIAMYLESLRDFGEFVTLGGFDSRRLQYARARRLRENQVWPTEELNGWSLAEFQQHPEVRQIYSQSAGVVHFLMHDPSDDRRRKLIDLLGLIYRSRVKSGKFSEVLGLTPAELDRRYVKSLTVPGNTLAQYLLGAELITELSLPGSVLTSADWRRLSECRRLTWLDVSGNRIAADDLRQLAHCSELDELFLVDCQLAPEALAELAALPRLVSLDLSRSRSETRQWAELGKCRALQVVNLAQTDINDRELEALGQLNSLQEIDLSGTSVTPAGRKSLQLQLPNLKIR